jgi:hypothetical protein
MKELLSSLRTAKDYCISLIPQVFDHLSLAQKPDVYLALEGARYLGYRLTGRPSSLSPAEKDEVARQVYDVSRRVKKELIPDIAQGLLQTYDDDTAYKLELAKREAKSIETIMEGLER